MRTELRPGLPPMPSRITALPLNEKGYPVPWFVAWIEGKPDFRITDPKKWDGAVRRHRCWICGEPLGKTFAFVGGPLCAINRTSAEPPSHTDCAVWAVKACPFLLLPKSKRRVAGLPEDKGIGGTMIEDNPGITVVWVTQSYRLEPSNGGTIIRMAPATETYWYTEGRIATRAEVEEGMDGSIERMRKTAEVPEGMDEAFDNYIKAAKQAFLPVE